MRRLLLSLVLTSLLAPATVQAAEPRGVAVAFGNTVKALYPDGRYQRLWLQADGSWEAVGRRGKWSAGRWSEKDGKVCLKQAKPFPAPFKYCTDFPSNGGLGVQWTSRDMAGEPIRLTVVKGIERPPASK
ncbi:MAG: hypothetical protein AB1942_00935 [Pseudomonadota bacterium]